MMTTDDMEDLRIICFDCGLNFTVKTDRPDVIMMFAEVGCINPHCKAVHALLVGDQEETGQDRKEEN